MAFPKLSGFQLLAPVRAEQECTSKSPGLVKLDWPGKCSPGQIVLCCFWVRNVESIYKKHMLTGPHRHTTPPLSYKKIRGACIVATTWWLCCCIVYVMGDLESASDNRKDYWPFSMFITTCKIVRLSLFPHWVSCVFFFKFLLMLVLLNSLLIYGVFPR